MTVSSSTNLNSYSGNGSTTVFAYGFKIFANADLRVILKNNTTGVETVQSLTTHYTVSNAGSDSGGNVTFGTAPASGNTVIIRRNLAYTQTTDYVENDAFPANAHEDALDRLTMLSQQNESTLDVSIQFPEGDLGSGLENKTPSAVDRANKLLGFDSTGAVTTAVVAADAQTIADIAADITTLAHIEDGTDATDAITNVNTIRTDVSTVSSVSSDVSTVANNTSNINTVATDLGGDDDIGTVAGSIANVNATGSNISNVNSVAGNATNINTVAADLTGDDDIGTVADGLNPYVKPVALIINDVTTVAGIASDVTAVANNNSNITSVANNEANINAASGHAITASTRASEASTSATEAATSETNAATSATNAATSATNAATSETNAAASATAAAASAASIDPNDIDINGGTIDGVALGSTNTYNAINHTGTATFSTTSNATNVVLTSTDGDSGVGPLLKLYRNSPSPASGDITGSIQFRAENSADEDVNYTDMQAKIGDPTDGAETAEFKHRARINGSMREIYSIEEVVADSGNIEFVVNPSNVADVDFRVKADSGAVFFVDATANGYVGVRTSEPETALDVRGTIQIKGGTPQLDIIDETVTGNLSQIVGENDGLRINLKGSDSVNGGSFNLRQYNGSAYQTRFQIQNDGDIEMRDDATLIKFNFDASTGNVNIGASTADADAQLRVEGDVRVVDANIRVDERLQIGSPNSTQAIDAALHIRGGQQGGFATFTGSGTAGSNVLTVTAVASGTLEVGDHVFGSTLLPAHMIITEQLSGTTGGVGTYEVSQDFPEDKSSGTLFAANTSPTSIRIENTDGGVSNAQSIGTIDFFDSDGTTDGVKGFIEAGAYDSTPDTYLAFGTNKQTEGTRETAREVGRFDHNGNFLVGKVRDNFALAGAQLQRNGQGAFTVDGHRPIDARRLTDHGDLFLGRAETVSTARIMSVASTAEAPVYANGDGVGFKITNAAFLPWNGVPDTARDNTMDLGSATSRFERLYLGSNAFIDGTTNTENLRVGSGVTVDTILDQDGLTSNSATALATQQSIKAYVDANSGFVSGSVGTLEQVTQNGATAAATVELGGLKSLTPPLVEAASAGIKLKETDTTNLNSLLYNNGGVFRVSSANDAFSSFDQRLSIDHATGDISFYEDTGTTAKLFWDASAESLGLGTTSPSSALTVSGSIPNAPTGDGVHLGLASNYAQMQLNGSAGGIIDFSTSGTDHIGRILYDQASDYMRFDTNYAERMRIDSSGRIGVGVTPKSWVASVDVIDVGTSAASYYSGGVTHNAYFDSTNNRWEYKGSGAATFYNIQGGAHVWSYAASGTADNPITFNEAMRIDASGNLGIGGAPAAVTHGPHLDLVGNRGTLTVGTGYFEDNGNTNFIGGARSLAFGAGGSGERMRLDSSGRLGLGTSSPTNKLDVAGGDFGLDSGRSVFFGSDSKVYINSTSSSRVMRFFTNNAERMRIDSSGNVGIGSISPGAKLDLSGTNRVQLRTDDSFPEMRSMNATGSAFKELGLNGLDLRFLTSNSERMRIASDGHLLVGKTSSESTNTVGFEVKDNGIIAATADGSQPLILNRKTSDGTIAQFRKDNSTVGSIGVTSGNDLVIDGTNSSTDTGLKFVNGTIRPRQNSTDSNGDVDLGAGSFRFKDLYLSNKVYANLVGASGDTDTYMRFAGSNQTLWVNGGSETARIDSSGRLMVGATALPTSGTAGVSLQPGGNVHCGLASTSAADVMRFDNPNGRVGSISVSGSTTSYNTSSDQRLKDNIVDAPSASDDIDAIQVRSFDWKADGSHQKYGMVAQELQTVAPEAVSEGETEEDMMGVDYSKLVPMLVKEIQSLRARVAQLEGEN